MADDRTDSIAGWLTQAGLSGLDESKILDGFCRLLQEAGLPLARALALADTLHPVFEGRAFAWRADGSLDRAVTEYGSTETGEAAESWRSSAFFHLLDTGGSLLRCRFHAGETRDFAQFGRLRAEGQTDVVVMVHRYEAESAIGPMDALYSQWTSEHEAGFADAEVALLERLAPLFALAMKSASLVRVAGTLAEVYLGRDAGRRVLRGQVSRGVAEEIKAVLWFSDLRQYTRISDEADPEEIIPFLNDYAEAVISSIEEGGGEILKLIGDGVLAIFRASNRIEACRGALHAEARLRERLAVIAERRQAEGRPVTQVYLGLHIGKVFYGNIGSDTRLDFTVVGPAVNEVSRIASLCRSVERDIVVSPMVVQALPEEDRRRFVSLGRYALRGVARPQELFTLDRSTE
ncbi:MAG: adenylate/guanylate cyclase domain-containing protein [Alsobacter sp.]